MGLTLTTIPETLTICRLQPNVELPAWAMVGPFWSITRTPDELSIVVAKESVPADIRAGRRVASAEARGADPLVRRWYSGIGYGTACSSRINLFAISTFDTDYVLVASDRLEDARLALSRAGHIAR